MKRKPLAVTKVSPLERKEKRSQDWRLEEQLPALQQTHGLNIEEVRGRCRKRRLFAQRLASRKATVAYAERRERVTQAGLAPQRESTGGGGCVAGAEKSSGRCFMQWYNRERPESAIRFVKPAQRHGANHIALPSQRKAIYSAALKRNLERASGPVRN
jgi:hypothetical protein